MSVEGHTMGMHECGVYMGVKGRSISAHEFEGPMIWVLRDIKWVRVNVACMWALRAIV